MGFGVRRWFQCSATVWGIGCWYLSRMQVRSPGPWAFVALRREYDIADYIFAQRNKIDARDSSFKFTIYDERGITTLS